MPQIVPGRARRLLLPLLAAGWLSAADHHVSAAGDDANPGTLAAPWRTVGKVNGRALAAGDRVLFRGGDTFTDAGLVLDAGDAGSAANPIVIGSYGTGRATLRPPSATDAIYLHNTAGIAVQDLILAGPGGASAATQKKNGLFAYCDRADGAKLPYLRIANLEAAGFYRGITVGAWHASFSGFQDVAISGCLARDNTSEGIFTFGYGAGSGATRQSHADIRILSCEARGNLGDPNLGDPASQHSGSGILLSGTLGGVVDGCYAHDNGGGSNDNAGGGPVAIWVYAADSVVIQNCLAHGQRTTPGAGDGGGFDIDGGSTNCTVQYCYSYGNHGPGYLIAEYAGATPLRNATFRYNISWRDGRSAAAACSGFAFWNAGGVAADCQDIAVYNNLVYSENATGNPCVALFSGGMANVRLWNNCFVVQGGERLVSIANPAPFTFQGNAWWAVDGNWTGGWSWGGAPFTSLAAWRAAAGTPETLAGAAVGLQADPRLADVAGGAQPTAVSQLAGISAFRLLAGSPLIDAGRDLRTAAFGSLAVGTRDFWAGTIPVGAGFDIGPHETAYPTVSALAPALGPVAGGTAVTITGSGLDGAVAVSFGGVAATGVVASGSTRVDCIAPAHAAGAVDVVVAAAGGSATAAGAFTYRAAPVIAALSPAGGPLAGGTVVTITGSDLADATAITFDGVAASGLAVLGASLVRCTVPAHAAGPVAVQVVAPGGSGSLADGYLYAAAPAIGGVSPASGPAAGGTLVTITGSDLGGLSAIAIGGLPATGLTLASATQATCVAPAHAAGAVAVALTAFGGTATAPAAFTYLPAPAIAALSPAGGPLAGGTAVTITGSDLSGVSGILFDGLPATGVVALSATQAVCATPARAAGAVDVVLATPAGTATLARGYLYAPAPVIGGISPAGAALAGGTVVTITGSDLAGLAAVDFGGVPATDLVRISATQATCVVPAHAAGLVAVQVSAYGGTGSAADGFLFAPPPAISAVGPAAGPAAGGTAVTITGSDLLGLGAIAFGGVPAGGVTALSATQAVCVAPAHAEGPADVAVTAFGGTATAPAAFTYLPAPAIAALSPAGGLPAGGMQVTITGSGLGGLAGVEFGGVAATGVVALSATQAVCVAPAHAAGAVDVAVLAAGGAATAAAAFAYAPPPAILSLSPAVGPLAGGTRVTITGDGLAALTAITFDGLPATALVALGATQASCLTPAHAEGAVDVLLSTPSGGASATRAFTFAALSAPAVANPGAPTGVVGVPCTIDIQATGGLVVYSASGLPPGLSIDPASGRISGTPLGAGSWSVVVTVVNPLGVAATTFTLAIAPAAGGAVAIQPAALAGNAGIQAPPHLPREGGGGCGIGALGMALLALAALAVRRRTGR